MSAAAGSDDDALARYVTLLERFDAHCLDELSRLLADEVRFCDPFNDVCGRSHFRQVFTDMLEQLDPLDFQVMQRAWASRDGAGGVALIRWDLNGRLPRLKHREWAVSGCSELHFDRQGRLTAHIDYWDAASALYECLPVIGWLLRRIRRRLAIDDGRAASHR